MAGRDYHVHTCFSDGANTPQEMVLAAIRRGMTEIGFSDHSYTPFDLECCMRSEQIPVYKATVAELKRRYQDKIRILCGIEQDYYSPTSTDGYDYVIGSVHYVRAGERYIAVDDTVEILRRGVEECFHGDYYALAEAYFETVSDVVQKTKADIIGHFDLVSKFNQRHGLFDEQHPRYVRAWKQAVDRLLPYGIPFEINTGAISRGYRTIPYPTPDMTAYIRAGGGRLILSSDSHKAETLCFGFEEFLNAENI